MTSQEVCEKVGVHFVGYPLLVIGAREIGKWQMELHSD